MRLSAVFVVVGALIFEVVSQTTVTTVATSTAASGATQATGTTTASSGGTTSSSCQDDPTANCSGLTAQCTSPQYIPLMKQFCPATCGFCGGSTIAGSTGICVDSSPSCPSWAANGFCTNPFYTPADRKKFCAKTCGLC